MTLQVSIINADKDIFHLSQDAFLSLTALTEALPFSLQPVTHQHRRGEAHPSCETENQSAFDNLLPLSHRTGNHLNEYKSRTPVCPPHFVFVALVNPALVVCVWVRCSSGAGAESLTARHQGRRTERGEEGEGGQWEGGREGQREGERGVRGD